MNVIEYRLLQFRIQYVRNAIRIILYIMIYSRACHLTYINFTIKKQTQILPYEMLLANYWKLLCQRLFFPPLCSITSCTRLETLGSAGIPDPDPRDSYPLECSQSMGFQGSCSFISFPINSFPSWVSALCNTKALYSVTRMITKEFREEKVDPRNTSDSP